MSEDKNKTPHYYPRKMRTGWCVAHEVTAAGITIERYGIRCRTYAEAYRRAEEMNLEQGEVKNAGNGMQSGEMQSGKVQSGEVSGDKVSGGVSAAMETAVSGTERSRQP